MKILVTGAAGFIGSHIVDKLCDGTNEVIGLDSLDPGVHRSIPDYLRKDVDYCFADLRWWQPDSRFEDVEAVIHLAALGGVGRAGRELANVIQANVGGTARLIEAARSWRRLKRIVLASSFSVYGANYGYKCRECRTLGDASRKASDLEQGRYEVLCRRCGSACDVLPITEHAIAKPLETYAASKYMQELCFRGFSNCPVTILRFSSVYGDRLRLDDGEATIIARLGGWIRAGIAPVLLEDGCQIRDWVYVGDLVDVAVGALVKEGQSVMNVCSGQPTTLLEACRRIAQVMGSDVEPKVMGGYRPGDMRHCLGDNTRMQEFLGRQPILFEDGAALVFGDLTSDRNSTHS
jgi:dTDP-L-rhamnose 4-epimerase